MALILPMSVSSKINSILKPKIKRRKMGKNTTNSSILTDLPSIYSNKVVPNFKLTIVKKYESYFTELVNHLRE